MTTPTTLDITEALRQLDADPSQLSEDERRSLDENGFLALPGVLSPEQVQAVCARLDELLAAEGDSAGHEVHTEAGTQRLSDLVNKTDLLDVTFTHPRVLAAVAHVLSGDLKLSSLNGRMALPGRGGQHLHADWGEPVEPGDYQVCNSIWLLDDFAPDNGSTRVVPGSHRRGALPPQQSDVFVEDGVLRDLQPDEQLLLGTAGTVVVFNSHLWHGGSTNRTEHRRRALHAYFTRRHHPQQLDQRAFLVPETAARLSPAARCVLDV